MDLSCGPNRRTCIDCLIPQSLDQFRVYRDGDVCRRCRACLREHRKRQDQMASQRALVAASRKFVGELAKATRDRHTPVHPTIIEEYISLSGGPAAVAKLIRDDMARVRGENLTDEERAGHRYPENVIQKYHAMCLAGAQVRDQQLASIDASAVSEDDLKATLLSLACDFVREDADFRREVAMEALKDDPDLLAQLLEQSTSVITTDVITHEPHDDDEEDDDDSF